MLDEGDPVLVDLTGHPDYYEWTTPATFIRVDASGVRASVRLESGEVTLLDVDRVEPA